MKKKKKKAHTAIIMADEIQYKLENVSATSIASEDIDKTFRSSCIGSSWCPLSANFPPIFYQLNDVQVSDTSPDLVSAALGGKVLGFSDEWFAEAANLLTPTAPIRQPGKMVYTGAWYDGQSALVTLGYAF